METAQGPVGSWAGQQHVWGSQGTCAGQLLRKLTHLDEGAADATFQPSRRSYGRPSPPLCHYFLLLALLSCSKRDYSSELCVSFLSGQAIRCQRGCGAERLCSDSCPGQMQQAGQSETAADARCTICLGTIRNAACVPTCFHRFCFRCIRRWASTAATCPLCREPFDRVLHTVRADDDYREYVVGSSAHQQQNAARTRVRSRSPQQRYNLRPRPTRSRPAAERRVPDGRDGAARRIVTLVAHDDMARRAAGEYRPTPDGDYLIIRLEWIR